MDERSRQIFEKYKLKIYKQVEPKDVIAELQILNIISLADYEKIQSLPTKDERTFLFVNNLPQKLDSLSQFVEVLREARYTALANEIDLELNGPIADPEQYDSATKAPVQLWQTQSAASGIRVPHQRPIGAAGGVQTASPTPDQYELPISAHQPATSQTRAASANNIKENSAAGVKVSGGRAKVDKRNTRFFDVVWGKFKQLATTHPIQYTPTREAENNLVSAIKVDVMATVVQNTVQEKATLDQFVKKDSDFDQPYMRMHMKALSRLTGTETFSIVRTDICEWQYIGNGGELQKFFKLISHNPDVTSGCWLNITGEVIHEHPLQVEDLPMINWFYLNLEYQVSSSSATNLELILSDLKPALSNLVDFSFWSDSGRSFPVMKSLLQQIPSSIDCLGFWDILLSENDITAVVEIYENHEKLNQIRLAPIGATVVEPFISLVQKIKHCSTIKILSFWRLKLSPENEKKFLCELKTWNHLEIVRFYSGEFHEEGQSKLEAVIETLPNLEEVILRSHILVPNKDSLKNVCMKHNVVYKEF